MGDPEVLVELTDIIDEGASGAVFAGTFNKERVAVKVIPGLEDKIVESEVRDEIRILRKTVSSPYFVGFRGAWEKEDHAWIAMEICEAGSAIDLCQICQTTLKPEECAALCASVLLALRFLHETLGIIHRDVKGKNILFTADGRVKLTDMGIAVTSPEKDPKCKPMPAGSPHWMAPELATKQNTCYANDIWSLGVTMIELAEGIPPHSEIAPHDVLRVIESSPAPSFSSERQKILGVDLPSFVAKCLIKDPLKRPTAAMLLKHPFVDSKIMHLMVSDKSEPTIRALVERALPIITEYREYERIRRIEIALEQETKRNSPAKPQPAPKKATWLEADGDLFVVEDAKDDIPPVLPNSKPNVEGGSVGAPKPKVKWSEADGDVVVLDETNKSPARGAAVQKWSEADGDLVVLSDNRQSMKMEFIETHQRETSSYEHNVAELNQDRARKRPESIRATEKLAQARQSARRQSEVARDSDQVKTMQARLAQIQSKFDKDLSKMKKFLPKGFS